MCDEEAMVNVRDHEKDARHCFRCMLCAFARQVLQAKYIFLSGVDIIPLKYCCWCTEKSWDAGRTSQTGPE